MNVSVIVATFGGIDWKGMGQRTAREHDAIHIHLDHGTLAQARNLGAETATGDWLCFLDADDSLAPGYFEAMRASLPSGGGRWLLAPAVSYVGRRGQQGNARVPQQIPLRQGNWMVIGTLVQREVFLEVGGFQEWPIYEDWDLWTRCWLRGAEPVAVPDAHYVARVRPESRNRGPSRAMKLRYHREISQANFPT